MRHLFLIIVGATTTLLTNAQNDTLTNSFEEIIKRQNPTLNYSYDNLNQIHNYSKNWDFDNDGIKDELYFVGTGGAHLYYFLRVILSSDKVVRDYKYLETDFPLISSDKELRLTDFNPFKSNTNFAVYDFGKNGTKQIYIRLDSASFTTNQKQLKKNGINTKHICITFDKRKAKLIDYEKREKPR